MRTPFNFFPRFTLLLVKPPLVILRGIFVAGVLNQFVEQD